MCLDCGKEHLFLSDLLRHRKSHRRRKPYGCSVCDKRFTQSEDLKKHVRSRSVLTSSSYDETNHSDVSDEVEGTITNVQHNEYATEKMSI